MLFQTVAAIRISQYATTTGRQFVAGKAECNANAIEGIRILCEENREHTDRITNELNVKIEENKNNHIELRDKTAQQITDLHNKCTRSV